MPRFRMAVRSGDVTVSPILTKLQKECATPLPVLRHVADAMADDMKAGLAVDGGSDLKMILSYVDTLPSGLVYYLHFYFFLCLGPFFFNNYSTHKRFETHTSVGSIQLEYVS